MAEPATNDGNVLTTLDDRVPTAFYWQLTLLATLGGFLFDAFGHIPEEGERLTHDGWEFRVAEMDKRRVAKVVVQGTDATATEETPATA